MSLSQKLIDILDRLEVDFKTIDGGSNYHNTVLDSNIIKRYVSIVEVASRPTICISSVDCINSKPLDQKTFGGDLVAEVFGYVEEEETNTLETTLKLAQDMEKVLYADPELNNNIHGMSLDIVTATNQADGVVRLTIRGKVEYFIT